ncbi:MAG: hypothetical protein FJ100_02130 [Deltaproteobacteria bacterium]|nr:hypothetical protein [Deltaproteobacteria bacterium]
MALSRSRLSSFGRAVAARGPWFGLWALGALAVGCADEAPSAGGSAAGFSQGGAVGSDTSAGGSSGGGGDSSASSDASSGWSNDSGTGASDAAAEETSAPWAWDAATAADTAVADVGGLWGADAAEAGGGFEPSDDSAAAADAAAADLPAATPGDVDGNTLQVWSQQVDSAQFAQVVSGSKKLQLVDLRVTVQVEGLRVRTLVDHIYKNPHPNVTEATFRYALPADSSVSYYAMFAGEPNATPQFFGPKSPLLGKDDEQVAAAAPEEVGLNADPDHWGKLMEAKVAEQVKATVAYETEIAKKIDPALGEVVGANTFQAKVYPIPANGYNRVLIAYEQTLPRVPTGLRYTFALPKADPNKPQALAGTFQFTMLAKASGVASQKWIGTVEGGASEKSSKSATVTKLEFKGASPGGMLAWDFQAAQGSAEADVLTGTDPTVGGSTYALVRIQPKLDDLAKTKAYAKRAVVVLDTSRSENLRFNSEVALFKAILEASPATEQFNIVTFDAGARWLQSDWFANTAQGRQAALNALDNVILEGSTDFSAALRALAKPPVAPPADKALDVFVLSDGDVNWGDTTLSSLWARYLAETPWQARFFSYRIGIGPDNTALYQTLAQSGGAVFNCQGGLVTGCATAHQGAGMLIQSVGLLPSGGAPAALADVVVSGRQATLFAGASLLLAARVKTAGSAKVVVQGTVPGQGSKTVEIPVELAPTGQLAARAWAEIVVAQLLDTHDAKLEKYALALSQHFKIASALSSFLVLEGDAAYKKYGITEELGALGSKDAETMIAASLKAAGAAWTSWHQIAQVIDLFSLWNQNGNPKALQDLKVKVQSLVPDSELQVPEATLQIPLYYAKDAPEDYVKLAKQTTVDFSNPKPWVDEADRRRNLGQTGAAVRALSTTVENKATDAEVARLAGYRLKAWGEGQSAAGLFLGVLKKRPFEPQSYRDLAGSVQGSRPMLAALLYEAVMLGQWQPKFLSLKTVVGEEYALAITDALTAGVKPDAAAFLKDRMAKWNLQAPKGKLRVTITWNTDATDIDLWVTDPLGVKCFYSNKTLQSGGKLLDDLTGGYGPERFQADKVITGKYLIQAHYFGSSAVQGVPETFVSAVILTDIGLPTQNTQYSNVVLKAKNDVATLAEVYFK